MDSKEGPLQTNLHGSQISRRRSLSSIVTLYLSTETRCSGEWRTGAATWWWGCGMNCPSYVQS